MPQPFARLRLFFVVASTATALGALLSLHPIVTISTLDRGDDLALAVAWIAAFAAAAWLFVATAVCLLLIGVHRPQLARCLAPALPGRVRRLVEIAIVTSCIALPAGAAHAAPAPVRPGGETLVIRGDEPVERTPGSRAPVPRAPGTRAPVVPATVAPPATVTTAPTPVVVLPPIAVAPLSLIHI